MIQAMRLDPWGLGYTINGTGLAVHYPRRSESGTMEWGAGLPFDPRPEIARSPDSLRAKLWGQMLAAGETE